MSESTLTPRGELIAGIAFLKKRCIAVDRFAGMTSDEIKNLLVLEVLRQRADYWATRPHKRLKDGWIC
jgi:hypothetical protein